jgi:DNA-binding transcriptional ArsR family regulator
MPVLFRREVPLRTIVAIQSPQARALQAPIRLAMLDLLAQRSMSVEDLAEELPAHGFRKATNTLRHHLEILISAGLVELAVLEQTRGAVLKYYAASARPLHFALPEAAESDMSHLTDRLILPVAAAMRDLSRVERDRVRRLAQSIRRCPRCSSEYYEEYVLLLAMHRACVAYLRSQAPRRPGAAAPELVRRGTRRRRAP